MLSTKPIGHWQKKTFITGREYTLQLRMFCHVGEDFKEDRKLIMAITPFESFMPFILKRCLDQLPQGYQSSPDKSSLGRFCSQLLKIEVDPLNAMTVKRGIAGAVCVLTFVMGQDDDEGLLRYIFSAAQRENNKYHSDTDVMSFTFGP